MAELSPFVPLYDDNPEKSGKVKCRVCGRNGWPNYGKGWQAACLRGHAPCANGCGRIWTVKLDGSARRCIGRPGRTCAERAAKAAVT
jgi:hypothetical protein